MIYNICFVSINILSLYQFSPYVNHKFSYAFGRGTVPLISENINYFLDQLEEKPVQDLLISHLEDKQINNHEFVSDVRRLASGIYDKLSKI